MKYEAQQLATEIFGLILTGDRDDKKWALTLLSQLKDEERQDVLEACKRLVELVQEHWRSVTFR